MSASDNIYFYGLPGSAHELNIAEWPQSHRPKVRSLSDLSAPSADGVTVYSFSGGSLSALSLAASYPDKVSSLVLIAPVCPPELGDFLPIMSAGPLLSLARDDKTAFRAAVSDLSAHANSNPRALIDSIFKEASEREQQISTHPDFETLIESGLSGPNCLDFIDTAERIVRPWGDCLSHVRADVLIVRGDADLTTPPIVSTALAKEISETTSVQIHTFKGAGHYETLRRYAKGLS